MTFTRDNYAGITLPIQFGTSIVRFSDVPMKPSKHFHSILLPLPSFQLDQKRGREGERVEKRLIIRVTIKVESDLEKTSDEKFESFTGSTSFPQVPI